MRPLVFPTLVAVDASANQVGPAINCMNLFAVSLQAVSTGASTGDVKLQFSNDILNPTTGSAVPTNWVDIPSATIAVTAASKVGIAKIDVCYEYIRAVYTKNNGSAGTLSVNIKALGA